MAIKAGMTVAEAILQLTRGFQKIMGRRPDGLEKIKIQQEAVQRLKNLEKVVDMQGNVIDTSKGIMGGRQIQDNKEFGEALKKALMEKDNPYSDLVKTTQKGPKTLEQRRKEAEEALKNKNVKPIRESLEDFVDDAGGVNPDDPRGIDDFIPDPEDMAQGGRAGFKAGLGKRFLELLKGKPKPKFDVERFREGPIDLKFLENIDKKDLAPFIRTRDTMGPGGYGMYDDFADMPAGLQAAELISRIKTKDGGINYSMAEMFIGKKLKGNESVDELIQMVTRKEMRADGGRAGFANGSEGIMSLDEGAPSILLRPRASGMTREQQIAPGINLSERDINYGISGILQGDKFYGGASLDKGKVKLDVETEDGQTLFKDTIAKDDALNFIVGMGDPKGEKDKFQIKFDDDLKNMSLILKKSFAEGGRANFEKGGMSRRQFMKIMGGVATLPFIGKYIKPAMPLIQKGAELTGPALDKIVQTVMSAGKLISQSGKRLKELTTKKKLKDVEVEEDIMDGPSYTIKTKDKTIYYRPGRQDEMGIDDDVIEVIEDTVTKKAGGGIARMLGE